MGAASLASVLGFLSLLFALVNCQCPISSYIDEQVNDKIIKLPGQPENVDFAQYSGYVTVNEKAGRALFYWLIEAPASRKPESLPLLLWLSGGPGCSSVGYGAAEEIGPFRIRPDGETLYLNPYAWNNLANLLFLDSPVGVGFSYSNTTSDLSTNGDKRTAEDAYKFLLNWFERFPQYKNREFYIAGESYAGHYVPQLSQILYERNKGNTKATINFKGFLVGNAVTDFDNDLFGAFEYWWTRGLISHSTYETLRNTCQRHLGSPVAHLPAECFETLSDAEDEQGAIDRYSIYTPSCTSSSSLRKLRGQILQPWMHSAYDPCTKRYSIMYFNRPEVQTAFHANVTGIPYPWSPCSDAIENSWKDSPLSMLPTYRELIAAGLRIWVFSGDTDSVIPVTATRYSIDALKLATVTDWYPWSDQGKVGGWSQIYQGLTLVTVRGAGHKVPLHRPRQALILFRSFLENKPMPK